MTKNERIVRYTAEELRRKVEAEGTLTEWDKANDMTQEELLAAIASDPDEAGWDRGWDNYVVVASPGPPPLPKRQLTVRLDPDIIDFFRAQGRGYQTRMNAVLRAYVDAQNGKSG